MECWSNGVLECWSDGVLECWNYVDRVIWNRIAPSPALYANRRGRERKLMGVVQKISEDGYS